MCRPKLLATRCLSGVRGYIAVVCGINIENTHVSTGNKFNKSTLPSHLFYTIQDTGRPMRAYA